MKFRKPSPIALAVAALTLLWLLAWALWGLIAFGG
jgi:hypothetical protein